MHASYELSELLQTWYSISMKRLPYLTGLLLFLSIAACAKPGGEWRVVQGLDYNDANLDKVKVGSTAGEVITQLGTPFRTRPDRFIYAVQRERPIERSYFFFSQPFTDQVTLKTSVIISDGLVEHVETKRTAQEIRK